MGSENRRVRLRRALPADAHAVARIHVESWNVAYRGIMPDDVIARTDLAYRTDPPGAEVRVDGKLVGTSPVTTGPLDPGPYHPVIATLEGYAPARRAAKLEPQGVTDLKLGFELEPPRWLSRFRYRPPRSGT